jgi:hypothetical protein
MVDTLALGASGSNPMEVQVLSSAPTDKKPPDRIRWFFVFLLFYFVFREKRRVIINDPKKFTPNNVRKPRSKTRKVNRNVSGT